MDIIRRYIKNIKDMDDRHKACEELITDFMANYSSIVYESDSQFIYRYFMSAILAFSADIDFKNYELLDSFLRFFISNQSGIWDIWSVYQLEPNQWTAMERCLDIELTNLRNKSGFHAIKYIIECAHKMNTEFIDPNDESVRIRFIDYPRFNSIESKSELWRNLHLPVIDCTVLPQNANMLRLLLQFGASIPAPDYQTPHFIHRISHSMKTSKVETLLRKLFWIKLVVIDISHRIKLYEELSKTGNEIIETLKNRFEFSQNYSVLEPIPEIPTLKQLVRHSIREKLRSDHRLPDSINGLEIDPIMKEYLNLDYI